MEKAAGWTVKRTVKRSKDNQWIMRKATADLQHRLRALELEGNTKIRQIDAEILRMRQGLKRRRLLPKDPSEFINDYVGAGPADKTNSDMNRYNVSDKDFDDSTSIMTMKSSNQSVVSGRQTAPLTKEDVANQHSQRLNQLLITNGEIDLNKILVLHLIAISLPNVTQGSTSTSQTLTGPVTRYANLLPSYMLSPKIVCRCRGRCKCNDIKPQELVVSVNTQIEMIIMTAVQVLARLNRAKLHILIALAHNPTFLQLLMNDDVTKQQTISIHESGIMNSINYSRNYKCTVVNADSQTLSQHKEKKGIVFKMLLPHHYPVFQVPVFSLRSSTDTFIGDRDESVPVMLNLYKQVTLGKPIEDEGSGLSVLPDFCNTRLAIISDDGNDFALISKSGNVVKPTSLNLAENLAALVRSTSKIVDIRKEAEDPVLAVNYNPRPKFSKNPAVMMESLIGLAKENLGLSMKPPRTQMGISEVQRRRMESEQLRCSILRRLSNTERLAIAKEAAKTTQGQKEMMRKSEYSKLENFSNIMASVMPKRSIMSLARNCSRKERDFMFKPLNKGGLGFGDLILKENVLSQIEAQESKKNSNKSSIVGKLPSILATTKSQTILIERDRVKNEIVGAELKEKVRRFVGSDVLQQYGVHDDSDSAQLELHRESTLSPSLSSLSSY